jgi:hypothetical protein
VTRNKGENNVNMKGCPPDCSQLSAYSRTSPITAFSFELSWAVKRGVIQPSQGRPLDAPLKEADELHERSIKHSISLAELIEKVTHDIGIDIKELLSSKRKQEISNARAIISYLAAIELGYSGVKIAAALKLSEKSVSRCIDRGKRILDNDKQM